MIIPVVILAGAVSVLVWKRSALAEGNMQSCEKELLPGVCDLGLLKKIQKKQNLKAPSGAAPRTRHLKPNGAPKFTNRLFLENSPYLLQHAHNPVNWHPWGEEAFQTARKLKRPILLSVGYSTCHWCHVMEEESFEDLEIARYLNTHYIAIKVDREERPDIDTVYMSVVQLITGRGGWPMTVWLTPDKKPFYGGTYFPARTGDRGPGAGFLTLLKELNNIYHNKQAQILKQGESIAEQVQKMLAPSFISSSSVPKKDVFDTLVWQAKNRHDPIYGGMQGAPKFPSSMPVRFLLRSYLKTKSQDILKVIQTSLNGMLKGGMRDHIGGGFHRYSTDEKWLVPHFEKMLYDQALLALTYLEAYHLLKDESYKAAAQDILDYVMRDMQAEGGGFYSAADADSLNPHTGEREEGYYFTWTLKEINSLLPPAEAKLIINYYGANDIGHLDGRNIFHIAEKLSVSAGKAGLSLKEAKVHLKQARAKLYKARSTRPAPLTDKKILTAWNGLMISAFVSGFFVLGEKKYLKQAQKAAAFIWSYMQKNGRLHRVYKNKHSYLPAYLDDYAFLTAALLDLFEVTGNTSWLNKALLLDRTLEQNFEDKKHGGFYMTGHDYEPLMAREKPFYDGAEPSGNSIAVLNLLRLAEFTGKESHRQRAEHALSAAGEALNRSPISFSEWMNALDYYHSTVYEVVLITPNLEELRKDNKLQDSMFKELQKKYWPHKVMILAHAQDVKENQKLLPALQGKKAINGKTTVYICEKGACQLPAETPAALRAQLQTLQ